MTPMDHRRPALDRRRFLTCACAAVAGTAVASGTGSAAVGDGDLTIEVVRHDSVEPTDDALESVLEGVELFAETWTDATPGTAEVTTDEPSVATFGVSPSHGETLDAIETDDVLRADRTPETVTLFVVEDGTTTAGAMRSYAGHDGSEYAAPGAYGYVNTELVDLLGWRFGTPRELVRNFAAHECGHAVIGWADFPYYPADEPDRDRSPVVRAHSCGAQDHPAASGWFVRHGITPMATGYSAMESRNTPRNHRFATEADAIDVYADPADEAWSYFNMDYIAAFSETSRAAMGEHHRQFFL